MVPFPAVPGRGVGLPGGGLNIGPLRRYPRTGRAVLVVVLLVLLDLGMGLVFIPRAYDTFRIPHPVYHHGFSPDVSGISRWKETETAYHINDLGFRDRDVRQVLRKPGRERTLLMGGAHTEGRGVPYAQTFAGILADSLGARGHDVMNAAVTGYSPRLFYLKVRHLLETEKLAFDRLMCFIDFSDVHDEVLYASFRPDRERMGAFAGYRIRRFLRSRFLSWYIISRSGRSTVVPAGQYCILFPEMEAGVNRWSPETIVGQRGYWTESGRITTDWGIAGLDLAFRNMKRLAELCRTYNIKLDIAVYPWPHQIKTGAPDCLHRKAWRGFAEQEGLEFIDLYPLFINGRPPGRVIADYFIKDDVLWNAAAHALVAGELLTRFPRQEW